MADRGWAVPVESVCEQRGPDTRSAPPACATRACTRRLRPIGGDASENEAFPERGVAGRRFRCGLSEDRFRQLFFVAIWVLGAYIIANAALDT